MTTTFFALLLMLVASPALLPHSLKPQSPIVYRGQSRPAVVPNFIIKGPAAVTDTVVTDSTRCIDMEKGCYECPPCSRDSARADSIDQGLIDPQTFTPEEFFQQKDNAEKLWWERMEFLHRINGLAEDPYDWTCR